MMLVKTYIAPSPIHGLGSFAAERIPAGAKYWEFVEGFDALILKSELPPQAQEFSKTWCHTIDNFVLVMPDDARFTNHADAPNTLVRGGEAIALLDIQPGEEITENYDQAEQALMAYFLGPETPFGLSPHSPRRAVSLAAGRSR